SIVSYQHKAVSSRHDGMSRRDSIVSYQHRVVSSQHDAMSSRDSIVFYQHDVVSSRYSVVAVRDNVVSHYPSPWMRQDKHGRTRHGVVSVRRGIGPNRNDVGLPPPMVLCVLGTML